MAVIANTEAAASYIAAVATNIAAETARIAAKNSYMQSLEHMHQAETNVAAINKIFFLYGPGFSGQG